VFKTLAVLFVCGAIAHAASPPAFEVASVKVNPNPGRKFGAIRFSPDTLTMRGIPLSLAVRFAYGVDSFQVIGLERLQAPPFYDIVGKAAGHVPEDQLRLMLAMLLAERFHLVVHRENKEMMVTALLVARGGTKFRASTGRYDATLGAEMPMDFLGYDSSTHLQRVLEAGGRFRDSFTNVSMKLFASVLAIMASRGPNEKVPVVDMTGLQGRYDFALTQERPEAAGGEGAHAAAEDVLASVKPSLERDLGLTLARRKARIGVLVVDRVDKSPTPN
jgi:uncharacterized protein (TIGR03435 family)